MKIDKRWVSAFLLGFIVSTATAATHYVDLNAPTPVAPYSDWSSAATNIQDAVDAAADGDLILVTNGVYNTGGRAVNGFALTNRVAVTKPLTLQSVNGPAVTSIQGYQIPGVTNGDGAVRCIYLTNNAVLIGFTLSNGATRTNNGDWWNEQCGGGAWCNDSSVLISNCVLTANSAGDSGGAVFLGTLANCVIASNSVPDVGGGGYQSSMNDCIVVGNFSANGGAGSSAFSWDNGSITLNRCLIAGNVSSNYSAGVYGGVLNQCVLSNNAVINAATNGWSGAADSATLDRCLLVGNSADYGGAAQSSTLYDCILTNNTATQLGGGVRACTAFNCTVVNNSAGGAGGGVDACELDNCIVYFNSASSNANFTLGTCTFNDSCTTPVPDNGAGNITADPLFVDFAGGDLHLQANSPCVNAGSNFYVTNSTSPVIRTNDFGGGPRIEGLSVDMGAYEVPFPAFIAASYTNVAVGYVVNFNWQLVAGNVTNTIVAFGDGTSVTNPPALAHSWAAPGDYVVTLTAFSDLYPAGVSWTVTVHVVEGVYYVSLTNAAPVAPFISWDTSATNIQDAVDAAVQGGTVWVDDGIYTNGARVVYGSLTNRLVVGHAVIVRSLNGPQATMIQGQWDSTSTNGDAAIRCVYLTNNATLSGFTISQGATRNNGDGRTEQCGGGIFAESTNCLVTNCVVSNDTANNSGGGAYGGAYLNCTITGNTANGSGGGVASAYLNNCTVSGNYCAGYGGGADSCTLTNSLVTGNTAYNANIWNGGGGGGVHNSVLRQCTLTFNNGYGGGGAQDCTLDHCLIASNSVTRPQCGGGGIENSIASYCTITGNHSEDVGGGVDYSALTNCIVANNHADGNGGGYWGGWGYYTLYNCLLTGNTAGAEGGGVYNASLYNCTVVNNTAAQGGGGLDCSFYNCLIYYNDAAYQENHIYSYFENCCTTPMPIYGTNNITAEPQLADTFHLSAGSPCRAGGNPVYALYADFDGEAWSTPPDIGCDQFHSGTATGALTVALQTGYTNIAAGFALNLAGQITGIAGSNRWDFGDGTTITNHPFLTHAWAAPGDYTVTFTAYNGSNPGGVSATTLIHVVSPPVHYVTLSSATPAAPFTSWDTAATNIQDAVDASVIPGAIVLVSNGVYNTGGRIVFGILSNRVAVTKPVTLQSANGAAVTTIAGNPVIGDAGVRCLWLTNGSALRGFTITQGGTRDWNGDEPREISGGGVWCQSLNVAISDCTFVSNSASWDGGAVIGGTVSNCFFYANSAGDSGGGMAGGHAMNCWFTNNAAVGGSGVWGGFVSNSSFVSNTVVKFSWGSYGDGASESEVHNSLFYGNKNAGADDSVLFNCSLIANLGAGAGGQSRLNNCLAFYNYDGNGNVNNYSANSILNYCCAAPLPVGGSGNISADPQLSDWFHIATNSPCRGAGNSVFASGVDIDGESWLNPPSIGADEYHAGTVGALTVALQPAFTNITVNFPDSFAAQIIGHAGFNRWDFGDATTATNRLNIAHAWTTPGDYAVTLTVYNDDNPDGVSATTTVHVVTGQYYVAQASGNPVAPFISWDTAATNIQDAVDAAAAGGTIFVSNGVYQAGGNVGGGTSNRIAAVLPLSIQSVNGPAQTVVDGTATMRCVYLTNGASFFGFTVTNGNGGGIAGQSVLAVVSNCIVVANAGSGVAQCTVFDSYIAGNSAYGGAGASGCYLTRCFLTGNTSTGDYGEGGGAAGGILNSCIVSNNAATGSQGGGGGVAGAVLNNCLVIGNSGKYSGGIDYSTVNNCTIVSNSVGGQSWSWGGGEGNSTLYNSIIYYNSGPSAPNLGYSSTASYCCTPDAAAGPGNFTNAPIFLNSAANDFNLATNSPCINAGLNAYATNATDLDGNARIVGGTVDIGAYEFQAPTSLLSYQWAQQYGLATDGSADSLDSDGDGMKNWQEWRAGTNPTNAASVLKAVCTVGTNVSGATITWPGVSGKVYSVEVCTDLSAQPAFQVLQSGIVGQAGTMSYTDTTFTNVSPRFYRVGVQ